MTHDTTELLIIFAVSGLVLLNALSYYSAKLHAFPDIIWVLLLGVVYAVFSTFFDWGLPTLSLSPDIVLYIFVPLLIFASTQKMCLKHFQRVLAPASLIASLGIMISMSVIAFPLYAWFDFSWQEALLFGAIVSATDPLAVGALLHHNTAVSEPQKLLIEGESILNDGVVVTLAGVLAATLFMGHTFEWIRSSLDFIAHIAGALILGVLIGRAARWLLDIWHEEHFTLTVNMTLAVAYGSFFLGEYLGLSGILAVFAAALAYGYKPNMRDHNKDIHDHLWEYFEYIANAILFFLLGASLFVYFSWAQIGVVMLCVILLSLLLSRLLALTLLYPILRLEARPLSSDAFWLLNFSGARGAVSIALILLLPDDFMLKPAFLSMAFIMIFTSLIVYPLVIKRLLVRAA
ncbi:cation:proton antiporter [Vibrio parahaemolyticus]